MAAFAATSPAVVGGRHAFGSKQLNSRPAHRSVSRTPVRAVAETEKSTEATPSTPADEPRNLSFGNNSRSGLGYTQEDSAGQSNIFAVEPKIYVQGSNIDTTSGSSDNTIYAITAGVIGVLAIAIGVSLTAAKSPPAYLGQESPITLTEYKVKFQQSLAAAPKL